MMHACEEPRNALIAFVRGELKPLERARVESHLGHCRQCVEVRDTLALAISTAQTWQPAIDAERLAILATSLAPYVEARRPTPWWSLRLAVAGSAVLLVAFALWLAVMRSAALPPLAQPIPPAAPAPTSVVELEPSPFVRIIADAAWDGHFAQDGASMRVALTRGFAVISFAGGQGRRLRVATPSAAVEVIGTRFFVEVTPSGATAVGVAEGHVQVRGPHTVTSLSRGETVTVPVDGAVVTSGEPLRAPEYLDDHYLLEHKTPRPRHASRGTDAASPSVLDRLAQAEQLALEGRVDAALGTYRACSNNTTPAYAPYRELCRYEMARLTGFRLGRLEPARQMLSQLAASADGEVRSQATLALCELDLRREPCRAAACLRAVVLHTGEESELRREALQLLSRWNLADRRCDEPTP